MIEQQAAAGGTPDIPQERRRLIGLQYLRGIAATGVVLFHVTEAAGMPWRYGAWGVDLFFVLSGFLMIAITDDGARPLVFFKDRVLRVVPLYWIATSAMIVAGFIGLAPNIAVGIKADPGWVAASYAFIPHGPQTVRNIASPILAVGWTLNVEMLFYTLFAVILLLPRHRLLMLTGIICGLVPLGIVSKATSPVLVTWTLPVLLEFVIGGWIAAIWLHPSLRRPSVFLLLAILVAPLARPSTFTVSAMLVAVLMLEARDKVPQWRPLLLLGDASYSIYLWQIFPLQLCFVGAQLLHLPVAVAAVSAFAGAMGGGIVAYFLIERPLIDMFRRWRTPPGIVLANTPSS